MADNNEPTEADKPSYVYDEVAERRREVALEHAQRLNPQDTESPLGDLLNSAIEIESYLKDGVLEAWVEVEPVPGPDSEKNPVRTAPDYSNPNHPFYPGQPAPFTWQPWITSQRGNTRPNSGDISFNINVPKIPKLADGGILSAGDSKIIGDILKNSDSSEARKERRTPTEEPSVDQVKSFRAFLRNNTTVIPGGELSIPNLEDVYQPWAVQTHELVKALGFDQIKLVLVRLGYTVYQGKYDTYFVKNLVIR